MLWEGALPVHRLPDDQRNRDLGLMMLDIDYANNHASRFFMPSCATALSTFHLSLRRRSGHTRRQPAAEATGLAF